MSTPFEFTDGPSRSVILTDLCPPGVVAFELAGPARTSDLYQQEIHETTTFGEKRRSEFSAGRLCAKRALAEFGIVNFPLRINDDRRPRWPDGIVGSISHTNDYCAALVARATEVSAIGFDVERTERIGEDLWEALFTPREAERLRELSPAQQAIDTTVIFSAKEAFYKCHFALSPNWLDFIDVEIDVTSSVGETVRTFNIQPCSGRVTRAEYHGRLVITREFVATSVVIPIPTQ